MNRYFMYLGYNGGNYCGWQVQRNGVSIQEEIEKALAILLRVPTPILGAGRTDAGVHARQMIAHFDADVEDTVMLTEKLNRILPKDIAIYKTVRVKDDAHARFDATSRLYKYYITTQKDPFMYPYKYKVHGNIDLDIMNRCSDILFDYVDFTSFSKLHTDVKTNDCTIMYARWEKEGEDYIFTIKANRFLRNMVRAIVGTLLEAGRGKLDEAGMRRIIEAKDRSVAGCSVPGNALFLEEVEYPDEIFG
ncbi:tRNA pseudouridine(38-40) synthase TruA [Dysgonomonas sp. GY617]|uniref:tRNA pseudouridine(38-40) synthase TruA n=1 Tax=Dysgonomonas sp. GY617 TaxID=2780420 RepID=UPI0018837F65|nr:tRNA pseudouridine(38-40) synthase TruA [Dysgonomonas sp. GY617]MBF0576072.1 tRNA pseudouridine(38-40) synthase TruA [Dysgonomonas sp. GY617]